MKPRTRPIEPGQWYNVLFGSLEQEFYIVEVGDEWVRIGSPKWLRDATYIVPQSYIVESKYLGTGKLRTWPKYFHWLWEMDQLFSLYTRPSQYEQPV